MMASRIYWVDMAHLVHWFVALGIIVTANACSTSVEESGMNGSPVCIGEDGNPVDMFIIYKLPALDYAEDQHVSQGSGYIYLDSKSPHFRLANGAITDESSSTGRTLNQIYKNYKDGNLAYALYNDDSPSDEKTYGSYAHSKGAVAFDHVSGFWLIHSVPNFSPAAKDGYKYPTTGLKYGQTMICVSFKSPQFESIAKQFIYNHAHFHDQLLPGAFHKTHPNMYQLLIKNKMIRKEPFFRVADLTSLGGTIYRHFAKDNQFKKDLYHDLVATDLRTSLLTETWQRGKDIGPSCTNKFHVEDISKINIALPNAKSSFSFSNMKDHSKFALGQTEVCIGDINRQPSQFRRGGGTLCFEHHGIWKQFRSMVAEVKGCK